MKCICKVDSEATAKEIGRMLLIPDPKCPIHGSSNKDIEQFYDDLIRLVQDKSAGAGDAKELYERAQKIISLARTEAKRAGAEELVELANNNTHSLPTLQKALDFYKAKLKENQ